MDRNGLTMGLVYSTTDAGTIKQWEYAPKRIVPELRPYHGNAGSSNWMEAYEMEAYVTQCLEASPHEGLKEFRVRAMAGTNKPPLREVAEKVANENAEKLFKRKIANDLIGTK